MTCRDEVNQMIETATAHFGKIDIVINNALVNFKFDPNQQKSFKDLTWDDYQQQLDGTLKAHSMSLKVSSAIYQPARWQNYKYRHKFISKPCSSLS